MRSGEASEGAPTAHVLINSNTRSYIDPYHGSLKCSTKMSVRSKFHRLSTSVETTKSVRTVNIKGRTYGAA